MLRNSLYRCALLFCLCGSTYRLAMAEPIPVRHPQGSTHGFLALKDAAGHQIALGDVTQVVHGDRITSSLIFRFHDGSIDEDTTIFVQRGTFRLISDHHIQRGPSFPKPSDVFIDAQNGDITVHGQDGKVTKEHMDLPADLSNRLPPNLLLNLGPAVAETRLSFLAATPKARLVHISIKPAGEVPFRIGGSRRTATDYVIHVEVGGFAGVVAPLIGKEPADYHIWILGGSSPAFIRSEGELYLGGPVWRIEQISATFPH